MKKKYIVISLLSIIVMMISVSYAYFVSDITVNKKEMNVSSKRLAIIFTDTKEIVDNEIMPGWSTSKSFTVENKSGSVFYYDINIEDLINTFVTTGYLQYKITSSDGGYNMNEFLDIPKSEEARREVLANKIEIGNEEKHTYIIEFRYLNDPNVNQSEDMDSLFGGTLSITESNIMIVRYKVNDIIQDVIPDKEEPYVVDKVSCSNNAKGIWNEETEKVDLLEEVTQTVCIVEFKEGHTVNILTSNGEVVSPVSKVVGRIGSTTFTIEEKEGYKLDDARVVCDNGGEGSLEGKIVTIRNIKQNNTCTVITNPKEITVTYNVNGGNALSPTNKTVIYTGTYGSLPTPTRTGYTFTGWYTEVDGGTEIISSTEVTSTVNHTIYASWRVNKVYVQFHMNGGTWAGSTNTTLGVNGSYVTRNGDTKVAIYTYEDSNFDVANWDNKAYINIAKTGYKAVEGKEWKVNNTTKTIGDAQAITSKDLCDASVSDCTVTLYVNWTANTYTVTYNQNGGTGVSPASNTVTYNTKYKLPTTNPTRAGFTFANWWTAASGGTQVTTNTTLTNASNHSLYAHWNPNKITLTLNNQSATTAGTGAVYYKYNTATYYSNSALSTTITKITVPSRTGYTFGGYYTAASGGGTQYINASGAFVNNPHTAIKANTTLYAKWTAKTITVTYNQNGGSGVSPASNTVTYNTKYKLPTTNPKKTGYTFAGWFTAASGGTQVTTNTTLTNASNHSIYAHWTINKYNVTLKIVNGTPATETKSVEYNKSTTFTIKANSGYKLDGATVSCTGGSYNQAGTLTVSNVTSARTCTVTLAKAKTTFTMEGTGPYNNSSPCYVIKYSSTTVVYNDKTYTGCVINSYTLTDTRGRTGYTPSNLRHENQDADPGDVVIGGSWYFTPGGYYVGSCSVNLSCNPA